MFENLSSTLSTALESIDSIEIKSPTILKKTNIEIIPSFDNLLTGNESFTAFEAINSAVETPSGDPNSGYGIASSIAALNARIHNTPYCPISLLGKSVDGGAIYNAKISGAVEDVHDYLDLLECLSTMKSNDTIIITIDSPGGYIHTGVLICTHIKACKGTVITRAVGLCASAGSLIWSAGDICEVESTALMMWHMSSHGDMGNSIAIKNEATIQVHFVKNVLLQASMEKGHITQEEIDRICTDPDATVYISATEMQKRIDAHKASTEEVVEGE